LRQAAKAEEAEAMHSLARLLLDGAGEPEAGAYLSLAGGRGEGGDLIAEDGGGGTNSIGAESCRRTSEAVHWLRRAAAQGHGLSETLLSQLLALPPAEDSSNERNIVK
jgi:TPR repeat protein